MNWRHGAYRGAPQGAGVLLLLSWMLVGCESARSIDLDTAVATAHEAVRAKLFPRGNFERQPVEITTEGDAPMIDRCLVEPLREAGAAEAPKLFQTVREKIAGKKFYIVYYPLPPAHYGADGYLVEWLGWEFCAFIDRRTGEVLGVVMN